MSCIIHFPSEKQQRAKVLGKVSRSEQQSPKHRNTQPAPSPRMLKLYRIWSR